MRNNKKLQIINLFKRLEHFELFPIYQLPLVGNPSKIFCRAKAPSRKEILLLTGSKASPNKSIASCLPEAGLCGFARKNLNLPVAEAIADEN